MRIIKGFSIFILLLLTGGNIYSQVWARAQAIGDTTGNTIINSLAWHERFVILMAGGFEDKTLYPGDFNLKNAGRSDAFVAIYTIDGNIEWAESFGGSGDDVAIAAVADNERNIYLAGNFRSLSFKAGNETLVNKGESDVFLIKINVFKEVEWAFSIGSLADEVITGLAVDTEGNIFISGHCIDFSFAQFNLFLYKIDPNMNILWQRKIVSNSWDTRSGALTVDEYGNCYFGGSFSGELEIAKDHTIISTMGGEAPWQFHETNAFLIKYDPDGEVLKAESESEFAMINALASDSGHIYIAAEKVNFGMGWGWPLADSKIFVAKYDNDLNKIWLKTAGGETELQSLDIARDIGVDYKGNVYVIGSFFSDSILFAYDLLENIFHRDYYYQQIFVLKYDPDGNEVWAKSAGGKLNDEGLALLVFSGDQLFTAGVFESDEVIFFDAILENKGFVREIYVHLKPKRQGRNTIAFFTALDFINRFSDRVHDNKSFILYPNPASDHFSIKSQLADADPIGIEIFTVEGQLVKTLELAAIENDVFVSVHDLNRGMYIVKLKSGNHVSVHKLIRI